MKDNAILPALSIDGWVDTPMRAADYLFSHLFLSDFSQTYIYFNKVSSIPYLLYKHQNSIQNLTSEIKMMLDNYFGNYYDLVECDVINTSGNSINGSITIYLQLKDGDDIFTLNKVLEYTDSKIKNIIDYNNG